MTEYGPSTYGDRVAEVYDRMPKVLGRDTERAVAMLAELAGAAPVLELGIGTGRLALPLAAKGLTVHGIDASEAMVKKLREKQGGERIPVAIGDFADVTVDGPPRRPASPRSLERLGQGRLHSDESVARLCLRALRAASRCPVARKIPSRPAG